MKKVSELQVGDKIILSADRRCNVGRQRATVINILDNHFSVKVCSEDVALHEETCQIVSNDLYPEFELWTDELEVHIFVNVENIVADINQKLELLVHENKWLKEELKKKTKTTP